MGDRVRLTRKDLHVGMTVPWNIYDLEGRKLLGKGQTIHSQQVIDDMCHFIIYHDVPDQHQVQKASQGKLNVFDKTRDYIQRIGRVYDEVEDANKECAEHIASLVKDVLNLCAREPDGVLGVVHVPHDYPYSLFHSLQCACLSVLIARRAGFTDEECQALVAAGLFANIGMRHTQETLSKQKEPIKPEQRRIVEQHPRKGMDMLRAIGLGNEVILNIILEHHERCDGSGYPQHFKRDNICRGALVLAVADSYTAMISTRAERDPVPIKEALQQFFLDKGKLFEVQFAQLLIKELTVFPPGCFVRLTNGETAVVVARGRMSPMEPMLKSILGPHGEVFAHPLLRDLSMHDYKIESICTYESDHQLNYGHLWGYV